MQVRCCKVGVCHVCSGISEEADVAAAESVHMYVSVG